MTPMPLKIRPVSTKPIHILRFLFNFGHNQALARKIVYRVYIGEQ